MVGRRDVAVGWLCHMPRTPPMVPTRSLSRKLTLIGHIARKHGLSIDSLLEAEMVLADGSRVRASAGWPSPDCGIWPRRGWSTD